MTDHPPVYILAGMHRSGTSFLGQFLKRSGVHIGDTLLGPHPSNPHGHYEDTEILEFHIQVLNRQFDGENQWVSKPPLLAEEDTELARKLIERRRKRGEPWGWKEPRTCLFLDFWAGLLPEAQFLFVFRHPKLVLSSLDKRHHIAPEDRKQNNRFLRAWILYNRQILTFYQKQSHRCILFSLQDAIREPSRFVRLLTARLGYQFRVEDFFQSYDPSILIQTPSERICCNPILLLRASLVHQNLIDLRTSESPEAGYGEERA